MEIKKRVCPTWQKNNWIALKAYKLIEDSSDESLSITRLSLYVLLYDILEKKYKGIKLSATISHSSYKEYEIGENSGIFESDWIDEEVDKQFTVDSDNLFTISRLSDWNKFLYEDTPELGRVSPYDYASFKEISTKKLKKLISNYRQPKSHVIKDFLSKISPNNDNTGLQKIKVLNVIGEDDISESIDFKIINKKSDLNNTEIEKILEEKSIQALNINYNNKNNKGSFITLDSDLKVNQEIKF
tara:strand:+ start:26120 stop:26848 length:729 start_codon:yes stop_codon:yes gene_type:complete